jgi:hypothetical protein
MIMPLCIFIVDVMGRVVIIWVGEGSPDVASLLLLMLLLTHQFVDIFLQFGKSVEDNIFEFIAILHIFLLILGNQYFPTRLVLGCVVFSEIEAVNLVVPVKSFKRARFAVWSTVFSGKGFAFAKYSGRAVIVWLGQGEIVVAIFLVVEFAEALFGRFICVVDAPAVTVPQAGNLFIPLFELHPGVDEVILLLQQ